MDGGGGGRFVHNIFHKKRDKGTLFGVFVKWGEGVIIKLTSGSQIQKWTI